MNRIICGLSAITLAGAISVAPIPFTAEAPMTATVYAHGHHSGGHHGNSGGSGNSSSTGSGTSHYYCSGHKAHQHTNGVCPYNASCIVSTSTVKKVQKKLNSLGYNCGTADGVPGSKTKKALKKFQKECGLKASGAIKQSTLNALGL